MFCGGFVNKLECGAFYFFYLIVVPSNRVVDVDQSVIKLLSNYLLITRIFKSN